MMLTVAARLALAASGMFLLLGLATGIWKYGAIMTSPEHRAPVYVDIAHRACFLYSFALLVMMTLAQYSPYSEGVQIGAVAVPLFFFATAVASYLWHGYRRDTDNQFQERNFVTTWAMVLLIVGEVGGVAVLVWGYLVTQVLS